MQRFEPKTSEDYENMEQATINKLTPPDSNTSIYNRWHYCFGIRSDCDKEPPLNIVVTKPCETEREALQESLKLKTTDLPVHVVIKGTSDGRPLTAIEARAFIFSRRRGSTVEQAKNAVAKGSSLLEAIKRKLGIHEKNLRYALAKITRKRLKNLMMPFNLPTS